MRSGRWHFGLLALGAAAFALLALSGRDGAADRTGRVRLTASARPPALPPRVPAPQPMPAPAPAAEAVVPLRVQVDRLLATHDPDDAFRAYHLVADCAAFNLEHDRPVFDRAELKHWKGDTVPGFRGMHAAEKRREARVCDGMTERERQARLDYLAIAVKAGVPGAALVFAQEGPFGDTTALKARPDDPLVREWKATARGQLMEAAEAGTDTGTLMQWAAQNGSGSDLTEKDPGLAYRYLLATGFIFAQRLGPDNSVTRMYAPDGAQMEALAAGLTPAQRAVELGAARHIAANAQADYQRALGGPAK